MPLSIITMEALLGLCIKMKSGQKDKELHNPLMRSEALPS